MYVYEACKLVLRAALLEQIADCVNYYAPRYAPALCERTVRLHSVHSRCDHMYPSIRYVCVYIIYACMCMCVYVYTYVFTQTYTHYRVHIYILTYTRTV